MNTKQSGFAAALVIAIIAVLAIGTGAYYYTTLDGKAPAPTAEQPSTPTTPETPAAPATPAAPVVPAKIHQEPVTINVEGMKKSTDAKYGFSFWYPIAPVEKEKAPTKMDPDALFNKSSVVNGRDTEIKRFITLPDVTLYVVYSPRMSILTSVDAGPVGSNVNRYYFSTSTNSWIYETDGAATGKAGTSTAVITNKTMGGLPIFEGYTRFAHKLIVPINSQHFVVAYSKCNDATDYLCDAKSGTSATSLEKFNAYVKTITPTDIDAGIQLSAAEQTALVQALGKAYATTK